MTVWSGYCIVKNKKNLRTQTTVWRYIRRCFWRHARACSIMAQDLKSRHGNARPQLWVKVVANFQLPSTVCAAYINVACRHLFRNWVPEEKKLRTERSALAWVQKFFLAVRMNCRIRLITSHPQETGPGWLFLEWDCFEPNFHLAVWVENSLNLCTLHTMLTASVRDPVFFPGISRMGGSSKA